MHLSDLLTPDRVRIPLGSRSKDEVLAELVGLATAGREPQVAASILRSVREREDVLSTGVGGGVAIPHGKTTVVDELILAAGVSKVPIDFDALDGDPVQLFFLLIGPESGSASHIKALSRISRLLRRQSLRDALREASDAGAFLEIVRESEAV